MWAIAITWYPSSLLTIFQNSSPLTLPDQLEPNLVWMFLGVSCIELMWRFFAFVSKIVRFSLTFSIAEMILIIRPSKVFGDQSCQATPCKSYCLGKMTFFKQFSANILKTIIDRKKISISEIILMISPTKVFLSQNCRTTFLLHLLPLKDKF